MNKFSKYFIVLAIMMGAVILTPLNSIAQLAGDPGCDPLDPACPIDGGVSLLIAAAVGLAAKKAYDKKKNIDF